MSYGVPNSNLKFSVDIDLFRFYHHQLRQKELQDLLNNELKRGIFEETDLKNYLVYGGRTAMNLVIFDAYYITTLEGNRTRSEIDNFLVNYKTMQDFLNNGFEKADQSSNDIISAWLSAFTYTTACYSILLLALYFFYYLPFMLNERKDLDKIRELMALIPQNIKNQ